MTLYPVNPAMAGQGASLLQPDPTAPVLFFEVFRRPKDALPEKRLMLAVLEDAVIRFQKYAPMRNHREARLFYEAQDWLFDTDNEWWFSFENICAHLGLDPDYVRRGLKGATDGRARRPRRDEKNRAGEKRKYRGAA